MGKLFQGQAICQRIAIARSPPTMMKASPVKRNWIPMILWFVVKTYFQTQLICSYSAS